ncbi:MAG TPA: hypothetical protein VGS61_01140 [Acidimicrobiales bacterium]|nr:hypothetical protein [Acidimicrobiales bacterium]
MTAVQTTDRATPRSQRGRWFVHVVLLATLAGSLLSLVWLSHSITVHVIIGVAFMAVLLLHFVQRRRTIAGLAKQLVGARARTARSTRLAVSDVILELLVLDVLASGIVDAVNHHATDLSVLSSLGFPPGLVQWHKLAAVLLVVYATVHVVRRRRRLRHSRIR